jgi:pre-mRNA-splicing helicase BRR2
MADREEMQNQYSYAAMSSKVVTNRGSKRSSGPTGEVEAIRVGRMGDRVVASQRAEPIVKKLKTHKEGSVSNKSSSEILMTTGEKSILDLGDNLATAYQPTTDSTRAAYESILTLLSDKQFAFASQGTAVLKDAAQEIIEILKDEEYANKDERISTLLTGKPKSLSNEMFTNMVQLGKQLHDYNDHRSGAAANKAKDQEMDDEGVAVVFEDESDGSRNDDDSDIDQNVVVDLSSSEDENQDQEETQETIGDDDNEDKAVLVQDKKGSRSALRLLSVHEIDAHFLQRQISKHISDADESADKAEQVLKIIDIRNETSDDRQVENKLLVLLGFDLFPVIQLIMKNRAKVWGCVAMKRAKSDTERDNVEKALPQETLDEIRGNKEIVPSASYDVSKRVTGITAQEEKSSMEIDEPNVLDLETIKSTQPTKQCILPATTRRVTKKGYEEVHVPYQKKPPPNEMDLMPLSDLPSWTHAAFKGIKHLNPVQSKVCNVALTTSENILLCAPTGAGKTNVACLTMLNVLGQFRNEEDGLFDLSGFKIVYIAPMKALVQEVVKSFSGRLKDYGITVRELSGDSSLTRQQISETQLIVTTPEKWDIVTRAGEGRAFTQLVRLVIVDEIHLLHDDRGPVLESIVARVLRQVETTGEPIRLVGLSATLPNYADVATFLRVNNEKGLFFFDHTFRPIPLQMQYIGISERNAFKRFQLQNELCYEKAAI